MQAEPSKANLKKIGKTPRGVQRYQCKTCGRTFTETKGTIFYRKHADEDQNLEVLALLAEGTRISTLARVKGIKEETILRWLREAARHANQLETVLMQTYHLKRAQIDGLWSFVANKGEKTMQRPIKAVPSGSQPSWISTVVCGLLAATARMRPKRAKKPFKCRSSAATHRPNQFSRCKAAI